MKDREPWESSEQQQTQKPEYTPPKIVTYTSEEILEQIGPAQACSPSPCGIN
jgi:hypothetical protein